MSQAPDYPDYVERSEALKQRRLDKTSFNDEVAEELERTVRDVIEEFEAILDDRASFSPHEFIELIKDQAKRLTA